MSDLIAESHVFLRQGLEAAIIIHLLLNLGDLFGGDSLAELLTAEGALEDEVRTTQFGLARKGFKELFA